MDVFKRFATDETLENAGAWRDLGGGAKVLVARAGNRENTRMLKKQFEMHEQALKGDDEASEALSDKIMTEIMAKTILLGWEGIEFKGAPLAYSVENARMLLGVKDFKKHIAKIADDLTNFQAKEEEAAGKS